MASLDQSALLELSDALTAGDGTNMIRRLVQSALQALVDAQADAHVGAARHERSTERTTQRNGSRDRVLTTTSGDVDLKIPKMRTGSFFPTLLQPRRRIDIALRAVVMEAYVHGVSTRKVDDLVAALGGDTGISKSEVSRICADLDADVTAFNNRPLDAQATPYVFVDATYCKARVNGRVVSQAVVIATGVTADGHREVLGCAVGDSETYDFWREFLGSLRDRGLNGVQLVISDSHRGLIKAIESAMVGSAWQRCRVHFMRNVLAKVTKTHTEAVATVVRSIFAQPTPEAARAQVRTVADGLRSQFPAVADMLDEAGPDLTAYTDFPSAHWRKIWSTNPIERLNREVKRRTNVVQIFPNAPALLRLAGCVLIEAHDEWAVNDRRYLSEASMALLNAPRNPALGTVATPQDTTQNAALDNPTNPTA